MLDLHAGDKVVAAFPVTVCSKQAVSPNGKRNVATIAEMENFRYDQSALKK